jgi:hypothetical protein
MIITKRKYKIGSKWYNIGCAECYYKRKYRSIHGYTVKVIDLDCDNYNTYDAISKIYNNSYDLKSIKPEWAVAPNFKVVVTADNKLLFLSYLTLYFGRIEEIEGKFNFHLENSIKLLKAFNMKGNCTNTFFGFRDYDDNPQFNLAVMTLAIYKGSGYSRTPLLDPAVIMWELSNPTNYRVDDRLHKALMNILDNTPINLPFKTCITIEQQDRLLISISSLDTESKVGIKKIKCRYNLDYGLISEMEFSE